MKQIMCALMTALWLMPMTVSAVKEGVVEKAASVDLAEMKTGTESKRSYFLDESYYAFSGDCQPTWADREQYFVQPLESDCYEDITQSSCLTKGEIARAKALAEAYKKGEKTGNGKSVLNKTDQVVIGVYTLKPDEFGGEEVFVLLPGTSLTDEQMLSLIDAYHLLGLTFDPEGLNLRNCARGGGIETTRFLTDEEQERRAILADQIRYGILKTDAIDTKLSVGIKVNPQYYSGMVYFSIRPYRSMTDEELAAELIHSGVHDESAEIDFKGWEMHGRALLQELFSLPMSMKLETISDTGAYLPFTIHPNSEIEYTEDELLERKAYVVSFSYRKNDMDYLADAWFDAETEKPVSAMWYEDHYHPFSEDEEQEETADPSAFVKTADQYAKQIGQKEELQWFSSGKTSLQGLLTERYTAVLPEKSCLNVYITQDGLNAAGAEIKWETALKK